MWAFVCAAAGCSAPSQVVLGFATDLSAPNVIDRVHMQVFNATGAQLLENEWVLPGMRARDFKLPGSFTLFADGGAEPSVRVRLVGRLGDDPMPVVERTAAMQFSSESTLFFRMTLVQRCAGVVCQAGESCIEGKCRDEAVETVSLRAYHSGREEAVECDSGSRLIDTSTQEPMATDGTGFCGPGEWCGEGTCYRNRGQGLLWCTAVDSTCGGVDRYESCIVDACQAELEGCYGASWRRGRFGGACRAYAECRSKCDCDASCMARCDAARDPACSACLDAPAGPNACRASAESTTCSEPTCHPIGAPPDDLSLPPLDMSVLDAGDMAMPLAKPAIPAGVYQIGCSPADATTTCNGDAQPVHPVQLSAFHIDDTEVTQAQFDACVQAGLCMAPATTLYQPATTPTLPVTGMVWPQAVVYCAWRGMQLGVTTGRLPTEAEWEVAAHGVLGSSSEGTVYPWGDADPVDCTRALWIYCDNVAPSPVGTHPTGVSPFGLQDMSGNVAEWVSDWYDPMTYAIDAATGTVVNPTGASTSSLKVVRGGSWTSAMPDLRAAARVAVDPTVGSDQIGFRCVYLP
jgi:formylglycine-generating enzyme required for sulfatase activity